MIRCRQQGLPQFRHGPATRVVERVPNTPIATFALQTPSADLEAQLATLQQDKAALEQNYKMLKTKYADMQDAAEQRALEKPTAVNIDMAAQIKMAQLQKEITQLRQDKEMIKAELDKAIADLEPLVGDA